MKFSLSNKKFINFKQKNLNIIDLKQVQKQQEDIMLKY